MLKKYLFFLIISTLLFSCSDGSYEAVDEGQVDQVLNEEVAKMLELYAKAMTENDPAVVTEFKNFLNDFDAKYDANLSSEFMQNQDITKIDIGVAYDPLTDLPLEIDGAVYLSGGTSGPASMIISYISPKATPGKLYHGAALDLDKFDPTNLETQCFQTAVTKGAGYETPDDWMRNPNVAVLNPNTAIDPASLNAAQSNLDYYCDPDNTDMQYGFFKDYANIFSIVTKSDNYYWYCTKVVWRIYSQLGIEIDSNTSNIDWTTSGLYSMIKAYYKAIYFYNSSKAKAKAKEFINNAKSKLVLAEEIYFSPYLSKVYEVVRD